MAKSRFEYVKHFELDDRILPSTYIVVRVDGRGFSKFTDAHGYQKPNDPRGLALMLECAAQVMKEWGECIAAFGESDEFSFVFPPQATVFGRRSSKLSTGIVSLFASSFVMYWSKFFSDKELRFPPAFDARCVCYPTAAIVCDYLKWRQVDSWINSMYNECFWALQQKGGQTAEQAHATLKGTLAEQKHEILHSFGINFAKLPALYRRGSTIARVDAAGKVATPQWLLLGAEGGATIPAKLAKQLKKNGASSSAGPAAVPAGEEGSSTVAAAVGAGGAAASASSTPSSCSPLAALPETDPGVDIRPCRLSPSPSPELGGGSSSAAAAAAAVTSSLLLCFPDYNRSAFLERLVECHTAGVSPGS